MTTRKPHEKDPDTPVEVRGYKTDPLRRGYQVLWNYENIYWRALVGNDAWGLYEALRGFCHENDNICFPSINLLLAILGISDRTVLTGRIKKTKDKVYTYPGLIERLQKYELVTAEVEGEGPKMRYIFHVNLTPQLLTDEQLTQLPNILQKKHAELLERCEKAKQKLRAKRRPPKYAKTDEKTDDSKGIGNSKGGIGISNRGSRNFQGKQYPLNTTQKTTTEDGSEKSNNSSDEPADKHVVVALTDLGISKSVSRRLARRYSEKRVFEKLDYLAFLQETDPGKIKNPRGWLRSAIEENYGPPDGYKPKAQREAEAAAAEQRQREHEAMLAAREAHQSKKTWFEWLAHELDVSEKLQRLTRQLQDALKLQMTKATYETWVKNTMIVELEREQARIAVQSQMALDWLSNRLQKQFSESLQQLLNHPVTISFEVIERPEEND